MITKRQKIKRKWLNDFKRNILDKKQEFECKNFCDIFNITDNISLYCITLYDTVTNGQLNKIIAKIYKLNSDNYNVKINCRKGKLNYIKAQLDYTGGGEIVYITFKNEDRIFSKIEVAWTQINNDEAVIQYTCFFHKVINNFEFIHGIIKKNITQLTKIKYLPFYNDISFFENLNTEKIKLEMLYFRNIIQNTIEKMFHSNYIKKYLLPIKYTFIINKRNELLMEYIKNPFLCSSYIIDENHYLVQDSLEDRSGSKLYEFIFKDKFNILNLLNYFSVQRMNLYYNIFYNIEKIELEKRITKFLNSKKIIINVWDYKWLLNKYRRIEERRFYKLKNDRDLKGFSNENETLSDSLLAKNIKKVYKENIEYYNGINVINYNILVAILSIVTIIIAIIQYFK